jgi:hypothetical protein
MKFLTLGAITLIGAGMIGGQAVAVEFGSVTLQAGETQTIHIGATARRMRACNELFSAGPIVITIGSNIPHSLSPGVCAEDIGDRMIIQSRASGLAKVYFRSIDNNAGHRMTDD